MNERTEPNKEVRCQLLPPERRGAAGAAAECAQCFTASTAAAAARAALFLSLETPICDLIRDLERRGVAREASRPPPRGLYLNWSLRS